MMKTKSHPKQYYVYGWRGVVE